MTFSTFYNLSTSLFCKYFDFLTAIKRDAPMTNIKSVLFSGLKSSVVTLWAPSQMDDKTMTICLYLIIVVLHGHLLIFSSQTVGKLYCILFAGVLIRTEKL